MQYSINLRQFVKRTRAVAKGNLLPCGNVDKTRQANFNNFKKVILGGLDHLKL
jgi:hypothetical protein